MKRARNKKSKKHEIEEMPINNQNLSEDINADNFEVSYEDYETDSSNSTGEYDSVSESDIPFSTDESLISDPDDPDQSDYLAVNGEKIPFSTDETLSETEHIISSENNALSHPTKKNKKNNMKTKNTKTKKKRKKAIIICTSVIFALLLAVTIILGLPLSSNDSPDFLVPVDTASGKLNVLLLGVDKDGERSDSIMLVNYDFDTHKINLLSIPRDTKIYVEDRKTNRKITEVHGMHDSAGNMYGASAVAKAVTELTGIPINYYLEFSFTALDNTMDILGPVEFDVPDIEGNGRGMNYDDPYQDLHIHLKPGMQELSGNQIQQFLRYRKSNYGTSDGSDISRVGRQQELLKAIIDQKLNLELITKIPDIFNEMKTQLNTNFSIKDVIKYAGYLKDISSENMTTYVLPGESGMSNGIWYYLCDLDSTAEMITTTFGYEITSEDISNVINLTGQKSSKTASNDSSSKKDTSSSSSKSSSSKNTSDNDTKNSSSNSSSSSKSDNSSSSSKSTSSDNSTKTSNNKTTPDKDTDDDKENSSNTTHNTDETNNSSSSSSSDTSDKNTDNSENDTPSSSNNTPSSEDSSDEKDETISLD